MTLWIGNGAVLKSSWTKENSPQLLGIDFIPESYVALNDQSQHL